MEAFIKAQEKAIEIYGRMFWASNIDNILNRANDFDLVLYILSVFPKLSNADAIAIAEQAIKTVNDAPEFFT